MGVYGVDEREEEGADFFIFGCGCAVGWMLTICAMMSRRIDGMLCLDFPASEYPHFGLWSTSAVDESVEPGFLVRSSVKLSWRVQWQVCVQVRAVQESSELQSTVQRQSCLEVCWLAKMLQHFFKIRFRACSIGKAVCCDRWHVCRDVQYNSVVAFDRCFD